MITLDDKALASNAKYFRDIIGDAKLCAVLKCDAYGHGLSNTAKVLAKHVDCIALGTVQEALTIGDLDVPITILLPLDVEDTITAVSNQYIMTVDSMDTALIVARHGRHARVNIKIDSGMCRLGIAIEQLSSLLSMLVNNGVVIEGIYSHCACGYDRAYTDMQLEYFARCCDLAYQWLGYMPLRHFANTQATLLDSRYHLDMVRIGLGLYGYGSDQLQMVKCLYGKVLSVKAVSKGCMVGYDNTYIVPCDTYVAVIDVGYWHGLYQSIDSVVINSIPMQVIGKVCMGLIIVDIGTNSVKQFDIATIIGHNTTIQHTSNIYHLLCATDKV